MVKETLLTTAATAGFLTWATRGRSSQVFGASRWRGPRNGDTIALTFDDGPSEGTLAILDILAEHGVPATFFQVGANVARLPEIAECVRSAGHEIGNHTHTHPRLWLRSASFIKTELRRAQDIIGEHTGARPVWFRAPYGVRWFGLDAAQRALGLTGVMWTVIGYDWTLKANLVAARIAQRVSGGAIICLHDGRELNRKPDVSATIEAVRQLVPLLLERGYRFETVSRLLCPTNLSKGF